MHSPIKYWVEFLGVHALLIPNYGSDSESLSHNKTCSVIQITVIHEPETHQMPTQCQELCRTPRNSENMQSVSKHVMSPRRQLYFRKDAVEGKVWHTYAQILIKRISGY